jgi:hypothetical protein
MTNNIADAVEAGTNLSADAVVDVLRQARESWENTQLKASNEALYEVLAKCLRFYEWMSAASGEALRTEFDAIIKKRKLKFASSTHTVMKIVRVVFDNDPKRASAYGCALRVAIAHGISHKGFVAFAKANHGIENLRKLEAKTPTETTADKALLAWKALNGCVLASVTGDALRRATDLAKPNRAVVLLATHRADGVYDVHAVVTSDSTVNNAFATQVKAARPNDVAVTKPANDADAVDDAAGMRRKAAEDALAA